MYSDRTERTEHISEVLERVLSELSAMRRENGELKAMVRDMHRRAEASPDNLMSVREAARYYNVSANTIRNWELRGKIHREERGGLRGFPRIGLCGIEGTSPAPK